jgi:myo-inositol-1(or 4)-monophosphatase
VAGVIGAIAVRPRLAHPLLGRRVVDVAERMRIRDAAWELSREVGALMLEGHRRGGGETRDKHGGGDLVTEYDERIEALLRERLPAITPDAAVVGEEAGGQSARRSWYVDPIDGTTNFAHGHPWFCLSMGLWEGDTPLVGVVHAPAMKVTYVAARGAGATRYAEGEPAAPMRVSTTDRLEEGLFATGFPKDRAQNPDNNYREFTTLDARTHGVRRCAAAALELAVLADGGYDGFWDRGLAPWDLAAGAVLIEEAGGEVTAPDGSPLRFDPTPSARAYGVVASNGLLHASLSDALAHARALPARPEVT